MDEKNLLVDGGFEDISLIPWEESVNISLWPFDPYQGQVALILGLSPLASASISQEVVFPKKNLAPKQRRFYRLQFYALGSLIPPAKFTATINLYNQQGRVFRRAQLAFPEEAELEPANYQLYTLETGMIGQNTDLSKIKVRFSKSGGQGTVLLDEISLTEHIAK